MNVADGPLKLVPRDGSVVIYSVGEDGTDDGGVGYLFAEVRERKEGWTERESPDIALVFPPTSER